MNSYYLAAVVASASLAFDSNGVAQTRNFTQGVLCKASSPAQGDPVRFILLERGMAKFRETGSGPDRYYAFTRKGKPWILFAKRSSANDPLDVQSDSSQGLSVDWPEGGGAHLTFTEGGQRRSYQCSQ